MENGGGEKMNAKTKTRIRSLAVACAAAFILFCGNARGQVTQQQTRAKVSQQQAQQRTLKPAPLKNISAYNGKISGVVYWDMTKVVRNTEATLIDVMNKTTTTVPVPPGCGGTQITVWLASQGSEYGGWEASDNGVTYSTNNSFGVCAYTIDGVPVGRPLAVSAYVPSPDYSFKTQPTEYDDMGAVPAPGNQPAVGVAWGSFALEGAAVTVVSTPCKDFVSSGSPTSLTSG